MNTLTAWRQWQSDWEVKWILTCQPGHRVDVVEGMCARRTEALVTEAPTHSRWLMLRHTTDFCICHVQAMDFQLLAEDNHARCPDGIIRGQVGWHPTKLGRKHVFRKVCWLLDEWSAFPMPMLRCSLWRRRSSCIMCVLNTCDRSDEQSTGIDERCVDTLGVRGPRSATVRFEARGLSNTWFSGFAVRRVNESAQHVLKFLCRTTVSRRRTVAPF